MMCIKVFLLFALQTNLKQRTVLNAKLFLITLAIILMAVPTMADTVSVPCNSYKVRNR